MINFNEYMKQLPQLQLFVYNNYINFPSVNFKYSYTFYQMKFPYVVAWKYAKRIVIIICF